MNLIKYLFGDKNPPVVKMCKPISRVYDLEKGTIEYKLAEEALILDYDPFLSDDYDRFTDNGDIQLTVFYLDLCKAYSKEIAKEKRSRLRKN